MQCDMINKLTIDNSQLTITVENLASGLLRKPRAAGRGAGGRRPPPLYSPPSLLAGKGETEREEGQHTRGKASKKRKAYRRKGQTA